jgi:SAM-dependent methyltransferase
MMPTSSKASRYLGIRLPPDPRRARLWSHLTRYLQRYIPVDAAVLDLGAGYCGFINRVHAKRRVAVDIAPEVLSWAAPGVEAFEIDATGYLRSAAPGQFDFILASNFLEHFEWSELEVLIGLIVETLVPGGRLALIQPNFRLAPNKYFDDYTHRTIFSDVSLVDWLESRGLTVVHVERRFLPLTVKSRMGSFAMLVPLYLRLPWRPFAGQMLVVAERPLASPAGLA